MKKIYISVLLLLIAVVISACGGAAATDNAASAAGGERLNVVTTIGMLADTVRIVGGERVEVFNLMGAGVDPHLYQPVENDVQALLNADVVFSGGLNLEAQMGEVLQERGAVAVGDRLPQERILTEAGFAAPDPHIWMNAELWKSVVGIVRDELIARDEAGREVYTRNAKAYITELDALHIYIQEQIASIPEEQRVLVTAHDAFQYYSQAYGIEVFAPQGISTESEAGVEDITETVDLLVERGVRAIFVETSVSPDVVEAIVSGAQAAGHEVEIGGELYSDALGPQGSEGDTYIDMLRHNTDTIVGALVGETAAEAETTPESE